MSQICCSVCGSSWEGELVPTCPKCLSAFWQSSPGFVRSKHDPAALPLVLPYFRSVLSHDVEADRALVCDDVAATGDWYYSVRHSDYCVRADKPLGRIPGSGQVSGDPVPNAEFDGYLVVKPTTDAHAFAVDTARFDAEVAAGDCLPMPECSAEDCKNLAMPYHPNCAAH